MIRGPAEELVFSDDEEEAPRPKGKSKKSKQVERPTKIIPTGSDDSDDSSEDDEDDERITMANMEAKSKALDVAAAAEAELDAAELRAAAEAGEDEMDVDSGEEEGMEGDEEDQFHLPTAEEREQEKASGGPELHILQRRLRECVRVLNKFKKRAEAGRYILFHIREKPNQNI